MRYWIGDTSSKEALQSTDEGGSIEFPVNPPVTKNDLGTPFDSEEFPGDSQWISHIIIKSSDMLFTLPSGEKWINRDSAEFRAPDSEDSENMVHDPLDLSMSFGFGRDHPQVHIWFHTDYWMGDSEVSRVNRERLIRGLNEVYALGTVARVEYEYHKYSIDEMTEIGFPNKFFDSYS
jgi:hypothetical protein